MGLFNSIFVQCPNCGEKVEFQTKSGTCIMETFSIENVPEQELEGIYGDENRCNNCGEYIKIKDPNNKYVDGSHLVKEGWEI